MMGLMKRQTIRVSPIKATRSHRNRTVCHERRTRKKKVSKEEDEPSDAISDSEKYDGADEETANPSQQNKTNKITADQVGGARTKEMEHEGNGSDEKEDINTN
jgi:hypothetical protein